MKTQNRNEPPNWSKSLIGALALSAVMSALILKLFSDLALAAEPPKPARAPHLKETLLGTYEITDIVQDANSYDGAICVPYTLNGKPRQPHENCGKRVWLVRSDEKLALLEAKNGSVSSILFTEPLAQNSCRANLTRANARKGLFESGFCRALLNPQSNDTAHEQFLFVPGAGFADVAALAILSGSAKRYVAHLPQGVTVPDSFEVVEHKIISLFLFASTYVETKYTFTRVSD